MDDPQTKQTVITAKALGWDSFFEQQVDANALENTPPVRVVAVHRSGLHVMGDGIDEAIPPRDDATVGDWLLLNRALPPASRVLTRKSLVKRRAPGSNRQLQLIAANIDTVFLVTSCNQDFNVARLERYVALTFEAGTEPVIVLTKTDLVDNLRPFMDAARRVSERVRVVAVDARGDQPAKALSEWCKPGRTIAFLGSSGVGKSTLSNALSGTQAIATGPIREADGRGRHTTTRRELHLSAGGCLMLDTPGMRELQLTDAASGIAGVFQDIEALAAECRFADCRHDREPGCAVQAAIETGSLDLPRLARWQKLRAEVAFNSANLQERRSTDRAFVKLARSAMKRTKARREP